MFSIPLSVSKHIERVYVTTYLTTYASMQWRAEYRNSWATESATNIVFVPIPNNWFTAPIHLVYLHWLCCAVLCCAVRFFKKLFSPSSLTIYYYHAFFVTHTSSFLELWFSMRSFSRPHTYTLYYKVQCSNASISGEMAKIQLCVSGTRRRPRLSAEVDQSIRSLDYKEAQQREVWPSAQNERRKITEL